jgi:hypothetical protein
MRRLIKTALVGMGTVALMATTVNAHAAVGHFTDPSGDSGAATDIKRVDVGYGKRLTVIVRYPGSDLQGSILRYYLDTDRGNFGPEYLATVIPNSDIFGITKVENWKHPNQGTPVSCPGFRAFADAFNDGPPRTWVKIPPRCIGAPDAIRVAVRTKHGASSDWARAPRTFLPSVDRF